MKFYQTDCSKKQNCVDNVKKVFDDFGKINHLVYSGKSCFQFIITAAVALRETLEPHKIKILDFQPLKF